MTSAAEAVQGTASAALKSWSRRVRLLFWAAVITGIASGVVAIVLDGTLRASFAAVSIVCLAAAGYCVITAWLPTSDSPPIDLEVPPSEPPVPQSQIALIYDPGRLPNNWLESDACKPTLADAERRT